VVASAYQAEENVMSRTSFLTTPFTAALVAATLLAAGWATLPSASANTCEAELERAERQAQTITDPGKQQAIEALLRNAESERVQGNEDRCMSDVLKAEAAMQR
jgi:hypothetical protein